MPTCTAKATTGYCPDHRLHDPEWEFVVRYAWEDQYPKGYDLHRACIDTMVRYASHFNLEVDWSSRHIQYGERWRPQRPGDFHTELMMPGRVPTGVYGARIYAFCRRAQPIETGEENRLCPE